MTNADACGAANTNGPCGGSVHCEGQIYSQAVWDLWNRDLTAAPFSLGLDAARELGTQLTVRGASGVVNWFACTAGTGGRGNPAGCGCVGTSGYQQFLLADDDNGNLNDGTPHMGAIFAAFSRHGIACTTPTNTTAGCSGAPTAVPVVTATPIDRGVSLSWTASAGATGGYRVYRAEGVFNCSFGKELIATTTSLSYVDLDLKNGRNYYYQVVPMGTNDECFSVASACTTGTPAPGANVGFAAATLALVTGDADPFLDNCETGRVTIPVSNTGNATQTNVRITSIDLAEAIRHHDLDHPAADRQRLAGGLRLGQRGLRLHPGRPRSGRGPDPRGERHLRPARHSADHHGDRHRGRRQPAELRFEDLQLRSGQRELRPSKASSPAATPAAAPAAPPGTTSRPSSSTTSATWSVRRPSASLPIRP